MNSSKNPSWRITTDVPESLNFAIYVGYCYGLLPDDVLKDKKTAWPDTEAYYENQTNEHTDLVNAWGNWWASLIEERQKRGIPQLRRPYTDAIAHAGLEERCQEAWSSFSKWWNMPAGGQTAMLFYTRFEEGGLRTLIEDFANEVGRPVRPFKLKVDLVYGGLAEIQEATNHYAIMPVLPSPMSHIEWWNKKLSEIG